MVDIVYDKNVNQPPHPKLSRGKFVCINLCWTTQRYSFWRGRTLVLNREGVNGLLRIVWTVHCTVLQRMNHILQKTHFTIRKKQLLLFALVYFFQDTTHLVCRFLSKMLLTSI